MTEQEIRKEFIDGMHLLIQGILEAQEAERKKGKWTKDNACEFCGFQPYYEKDIHTLSFCPHCGAKMDGGGDT